MLCRQMQLEKVSIGRLGKADMMIALCKRIGRSLYYRDCKNIQFLRIQAGKYK